MWPLKLEEDSRVTIPGCRWEGALAAEAWLIGAGARAVAATAVERSPGARDSGPRPRWLLLSVSPTQNQKHRQPPSGALPTQDRPAGTGRFLSHPGDQRRARLSPFRDPKQCRVSAPRVRGRSATGPGAPSGVPDGAFRGVQGRSWGGTQ